MHNIWVLLMLVFGLVVFRIHFRTWYHPTWPRTNFRHKENSQITLIVTNSVWCGPQSYLVRTQTASGLRGPPHNRLSSVLRAYGSVCFFFRYDFTVSRFFWYDYVQLSRFNKMRFRSFCFLLVCGGVFTLAQSEEVSFKGSI